jgi:Lon protease-like protein
MTVERTPMFPLGTVLLPAQRLPLQVFEPRYQAMVQTCLEGPPEFGVVLIERGSEVGGGDIRSDVGTVARIVEATGAPDGRWMLLVVGDRRVRVKRWLDDDPHPWAELEAWPDPPPTIDVDHHLGSAVTAVRRVLALATELGHNGPASTFDAPDDPIRASYALSSIAPLGPFDRQRLLRAETVEARLDDLTACCDEVRDALGRSFEA